MKERFKQTDLVLINVHNKELKIVQKFISFYLFCEKI